MRVSRAGIALAVGVVGGAAALVVLDTSTWTVIVACLAAVWGACGAVAWRPADGSYLGRLLLSVGAVGVVAAAASVRLADGAGADVAGVIRALGVAVGIGLLFHLVVALPTGVLGRSRRRWLVGAGYAAVVPVAIAGIARRPDVPAAPVWLTVVALSLVAATAFTVEAGRAGRRDRARLQWSLWGVVVAAAGGGAVWTLSTLTGWPAETAMVATGATVVIPIGLALSTIDRARARAGRILVDTIVVAGLAALVGTVYLVVIVGLDGVPSARERTIVSLSLVAAALIALCMAPARARLVEFANQRIYGEHIAPDEALRTFSTRMSRSVPMDELLLQLVETLRTSMELSVAEVWTGSGGDFECAVSVPRRDRRRLSVDGERLTVVSRARVVGNGWLSVWLPAMLDGRERSQLRVAPIAHLGELLGFIVAERPGDAPPFDAEEDRALGDLTRQVGLALHNLRLDSALQASLEELTLRNAELQASRARIVAAADASRRRIERDLHDGAQQYLVAMAVKLGLTRQLVDKDPAAAHALLDELRSDVQATVSELRELAHGIYPPLLRDVGLPEALRAAAKRSTLPTTVTADELGRFETDAEAAVYFCCLEALQNAQKHAGEGATVAVTVARTGRSLRFEVRDDGVGFDVDGTTGGQGFVNMTDRLGAVGGSLTVTSTPGGGTAVTGTLPLTS